ncbi:MAG TPA: GntR family transcriptional regulator [Patescibacteria group bacterium]|nr:GntR family transcriptional regulator [Patescibacteria group bacterium]
MGKGLETLNVLESRTLADMLYDAVRAAILSGELLPGSRLRETELAERMHVSRTPVREALCRLESEGMIEYIPRRGMVIRGFSDQEVRELFALRLALEPVVVEQGTDRIGPDELQQLQDLLGLLHDMVHAGREAEFYRYFRQFGEVLMRVADMPLLTSMVNTCRERLLRCGRAGRDLVTGEAQLELLRQGRRCVAIFRAVQSRDAVLAGQWQKTFLEAERDSYLQGMNGDQEALQAVAATLE